MSAILDQLGRNPFTDEVDDHTYFTDELHEEIERKVSYLTEFSNTIIFLHSVHESGKTTLLNHLVQLKSDEWTTCVFDSLNIAQWNDVLTGLAQCYDIPVSEPPQMEQQIRSKLQDSIEHKKNVVILDNADRLPVAVLSRLHAFSIDRNDPEQKFLHIIVCGRVEPDQITERYLSNEELKNLITFIELPSFDIEQTGKYIRKRMEACGFDGVSPFDEKTVTRIQIQSKGQPSHINALAYSVLMQPTPEAPVQKPAKPEKSDRPPPYLGFKIIAAALALSVLASTFFMSREKSDVQETVQPERTLPDNDNRVTEELALPAQFDREEKSVTPKQPENTPVTGEQPAQAIEAEKITLPSTPAAVATTPEKQTPSTPPLSQTLEQNRTWILSQDKAHYTVQLLGVSKESAITSFIAANDIKEKSVYYHRTRAGKDWYTLLYGEYASRAHATQAANQLKASLGIKSTWIRTFGDVQRELGGN